jgi:hypothetical protein
MQYGFEQWQLIPSSHLLLRDACAIEKMGRGLMCYQTCFMARMPKERLAVVVEIAGAFSDCFRLGFDCSLLCGIAGNKEHAKETRLSNYLGTRPRCTNDQTATHYMVLFLRIDPDKRDDSTVSTIYQDNIQ